MKIENLPKTYNEIISFLNDKLPCLKITPAGSTRYMLSKPNGNRKSTKDIDLIGVIPETNDLSLHVKRIKLVISKYKSIIVIINNFPNLISFYHDGVSVDLFLVLNNDFDVRFVKELRFSNNESNPLLKGSYKNALINAIIKDKGYMLDYNNIIRLRYIDKIISNDGDIKYLSNYYLFTTKPNEYNITDYKYEIVSNVYWLDLFSDIFNCEFSITDWDTFDNIMNTLMMLYNSDKISNIKIIFNEFRMEYYSKKQISNIVEEKIADFLINIK